MEQSMTAQEMDRLSQWLKAQGHTAEEVLECLAYIAKNPNPSK